MKTVLGIIGSCRKKGNSELAAKMISRQVPEPHLLHLIRLNDLNIKPCLGCYSCVAREGKCVHDDDMEMFLQALLKADGVILAVPAYFFGPNAMIKMVIDRSAMIYPRFEKFYGKPCVIAILLGIRGKDGYTSAALGSAAMTMGLHIVGRARFLAGGAGEVLLSEDNHALAKDLGRKLFSPEKKIVGDGRCCQMCGAHSFKFIDGGGIECLVCQNQGEIIFDGGAISVRIEKNPESEVNDLEDRHRHLLWVKGQQAEYPKKREEIKKRRQEFADYGIWVNPK